MTSACHGVRENKMRAAPCGAQVSTVLVEPDDAIALMVLGHGSGTPIHRPVMVQMAEALADQKIATFRYNYPYSETMTSYSSDLIDPLDVLLATTSSAVTAARKVSPDLPLFLGGRSMSSHVVTLAMARENWPDVLGVALYVFPMRWGNLLGDTVGHLQQVRVPMLFVQGGRDEKFCDLREFQPVVDGLGNKANLHVVKGADHFYDMPEGSDRTRADALSEVASVTAAWVRKQLD